LPFRFTCDKKRGGCGRVVYEDDNPNANMELVKPNNCDPSFYMRNLQQKLKNCPYCGRQLQFPPSRIEVWAIGKPRIVEVAEK